MHVEITVELDDGTTITRRCEAPLGSWSRPVPPGRIHAKAEALGAGAIVCFLASRKAFGIRELMELADHEQL